MATELKMKSIGADSGRLIFAFTDTEGRDYEMPMSLAETSLLISSIYAETSAALSQPNLMEIETTLPIEGLRVARFPQGRVLRINVAGEQFVDFHAQSGSEVDQALGLLSDLLAKATGQSPVPIPAKSKQ